MPRSRGTSKTNEAAQGTERVASPENNSDSDDEILETSENGRYQKMNEQASQERGEKGVFQLKCTFCVEINKN